MAKLKYDRLLNIPFEDGTQVTVPKDEVWKITAQIDRGSNLKGISTNLYGGGTNSTVGVLEVPLLEMYSPASPSSTSTSKRRHGGGAPWLRNLSLTDRCRLSLKKIARLLFLQAKCGKYVPGNAQMTLICSYMMETFAQSIELLVRVRCLRASVARLSPASLLRSASNNIVEGVTLYA